MPATSNHLRDTGGAAPDPFAKVGLTYDAKSSYSKVPDYVTYPSVTQLFSNATAVGAQLLRQLPAYAAQVVSANGNVTKAADIERFFKIQWDLIFKSHIPVAEILVEPS